MYARPLPRGVSLGTLAPTQAGTLWGLIVGLPEANSSGDADGEQGPRSRQPAGRVEAVGDLGVLHHHSVPTDRRGRLRNTPTVQICRVVLEAANLCYSGPFDAWSTLGYVR
jgi:hypothetical protein